MKEDDLINIVGALVFGPRCYFCGKLLSFQNETISWTPLPLNDFKPMKQEYAHLACWIDHPQEHHLIKDTCLKLPELIMLNKN